MKRKIVTLLVCGICIFSLSACSVSFTPNKESKESNAESTEESTKESEEASKSKESRKESEDKKKSEENKKEESKKETVASKEEVSNEESTTSKEESTTSKEESMMDTDETEKKVLEIIDSLPEPNTPEPTGRTEVVESDDFWSNPVIVVDGVSLDTPIKYSEIQSMGYDFNLADYGESESYSLDAGESLLTSIKLKNDDYDKNFEVRVSFTNNDESGSKKLKECDLSSIKFDRLYGNKTFVEDIPDVALSCGVTWGNTYDEVVKILGEPTWSYDSDYYSTYDFKNQDGDLYPKVTLTISKNYGVVGIELSTSL